MFLGSIHAQVSSPSYSGQKTRAVSSKEPFRRLPVAFPTSRTVFWANTPPVADTMQARLRTGTKLKGAPPTPMHLSSKAREFKASSVCIKRTPFPPPVSLDCPSKLYDRPRSPLKFVKSHSVPQYSRGAVVTTPSTHKADDLQFRKYEGGRETDHPASEAANPPPKNFSPSRISPAVKAPDLVHGGSGW